MGAQPSRRKSDLFEPDELVALARHDIEQDRIEDALSKLKQVLAQPKPFAEGIVIAARLYAQLGLFKRAQELFEQYLAINPNAPVETFQLGMAHFDSGEFPQAQQLWEKLLKLQPTHPPALFYSGLMAAQQGKIADAKHQLDILLKSAPEDNLYFGRAKELLKSIDDGLQIAIAKESHSSALATPNAYGTEH